MMWRIGTVYFVPRTAEIKGWKRFRTTLSFYKDDRENLWQQVEHLTIYNQLSP